MNTFKFSIEGMEDIILADEDISFMYNSSLTNVSEPDAKSTFSLLIKLADSNQNTIDKLMEFNNTIKPVISRKKISISVLGSANNYLTIVSNATALNSNLIAGSERSEKAISDYVRVEIYLG